LIAFGLPEWGGLCHRVAVPNGSKNNNFDLEGERGMDRRTAPESFYEALRRLVEVMGGARVVGHRLRPERSVSDARVWLLNCLNDDRQEKLDPEQVLLLLRWGHEAGCHDAMHYVCSTSGYADPAPLTPVDELADLSRKAMAAAQRSEQANRELFARMTAAGLNLEAHS